MKGTQSLGLFFQPVSRLQLEGYCDAYWASCVDDRKSTSGHCIFLGSNLISWCSQKQKTVAKSTAESEYRALSLAATEIVWLQTLFKEIGISLAQPAILWCDNQSATALASNPVFHARTKHIEIDVHFVREKVVNKEIEVRYVPTEEQTADILTKSLTSARFDYLKCKLSLAKASYA